MGDFISNKKAGVQPQGRVRIVGPGGKIGFGPPPNTLNISKQLLHPATHETNQVSNLVKRT